MGASAGGVEALRSVVAGFAEDLQATVLVVLHIPPSSASNLPDILSRAGPLPVEHARDGQPLTPGCIFVAPPDSHLTVVDGRMNVVLGPRENGHRPAIDPLFRSAARHAGPGVIGVVLSGSLDDGSTGMRAIKEAGGTAIIQHPDDALFPGMPSNAAEMVAIDHARPASELGPLISELVAAAPGGDAVRSDQEERRNAEEPAEGDYIDLYRDPPGRPSHYSCPECGGVLWRADDPLDADLRCRVGHAYSFQALEREQRTHVEAALWTALRALEESALTAGRLAADSRTADRPQAAERFNARQERAERQAAVIRQALTADEQARAPAD